LSDLVVEIDKLNSIASFDGSRFNLLIHCKFDRANEFFGSQSSSLYSINYSLEEYASNSVRTIKEICDAENIPHPHIISESGRAITAHHSCLIMNVVEGIQSKFKDECKIPPALEKSSIAQEAQKILVNITPKKSLVAYHNALALREDTLNRFKLGLASLEERAFVEEVVREIRRWILRNRNRMKRMAEELQEMVDETHSQFLVNFSVFQSAPDHWAFDQLFPIVPLHRMLEKPKQNCTLVDISCDSDGVIDRFVDREEDYSTSLRLHQLNGKPYYLGMFLTGAYQDVMGDLHNLFGRVNEVHVFMDDKDPEDFYIEEIIRGDTISTVLDANQFSAKELIRSVKLAVDEQIKAGTIKARDGIKLVDFYDKITQGYTYLRN